MRKIIFLTLAVCTFEAIAYNQADLLNAQTNYQTAKANLDQSKTTLTAANAELSKAESEKQMAKKRLTDAEKALKNKQESAVIAKHNLDTATTVHNNAGTTVNNIWKELNTTSK